MFSIFSQQNDSHSVAVVQEGKTTATSCCSSQGDSFENLQWLISSLFVIMFAICSYHGRDKSCNYYNSLLLYRYTNNQAAFGQGSILAWGSIYITGKTRFIKPWKTSKCSKILGWDPSSKKTTSPLHSQGYHRLHPEYRSTENSIACQKSRPQPDCTLVGSAWTCWMC